jgi:hypothetical protein
MTAIQHKNDQVNEDNIARLTDAAYRAILERGFRGSFLKLELSLWDAIRAATDAAPRERDLASADRFALAELN